MSHAIAQPLGFGVFMSVVGTLILRFRAQLVEFQLRQLHDGKPLVRGMLYVVSHSPRPMDVRERFRENVLLSGGGLVVGGCMMLVLTILVKR
jgi:hypothetical protein